MVYSYDGRAASGHVCSDDLNGCSWWLHAQESMNWLWTDQIKPDTPAPAIRSDVFTLATSELKLPDGNILRSEALRGQTWFMIKCRYSFMLFTCYKCSLDNFILPLATYGNDSRAKTTLNYIKIKSKQIKKNLMK